MSFLLETGFASARVHVISGMAAFSFRSFLEGNRNEDRYGTVRHHVLLQFKNPAHYGGGGRGFNNI